MDRGHRLADVERAPLQLGVGDRFARRYDVVGHLGRGGMGAVLDVVDVADGSRAALKIMHASLAGDLDLRARFARESELLGAIASPHLVRILHAGIDDESGAAFYVMERLEGEDLGARLKRGPLPWTEAKEVLGALAAALDETHRAGVVHRDLKPENLYLAVGSGDRPLLKVLDFGVAKVLADSGASLHSTRTLGSPLYMSPEQLEGEATIDGRSDVYAFGHVAYALLAGQAYWEEAFRRARGVFPVVMRVMRGAVDAPSARLAGSTIELPPGFDGWFARTTARDPDERFDTAGEAFAGLLGASERTAAVRAKGPRAASTNGAVREPPRKPSRRRQILAAIAIVGGATLGVGALAGGARPDATSRVVRPASTEAAPIAVELPSGVFAGGRARNITPQEADSELGSSAKVPKAVAAPSGRTPASAGGSSSSSRGAAASAKPPRRSTASPDASSGIPVQAPRSYDPTDVR